MDLDILDKKKQHAQVEKIYSEGLKTFDRLLSDLQPASPALEKRISTNTQKVIDVMLDLKHMATK